MEELKNIKQKNKQTLAEFNDNLEGLKQKLIQISDQYTSYPVMLNTELNKHKDVCQNDNNILREFIQNTHVSITAQIDKVISEMNNKIDDKINIIVGDLNKPIIENTINSINQIIKTKIQPLQDEMNNIKTTLDDVSNITTQPAQNSTNSLNDTVNVLINSKIQPLQDDRFVETHKPLYPQYLSSRITYYKGGKNFET